MHLPPRRPPETPMALSVEVAGPGRRISKKSATFLPGRRRRGGVPPRSRPIMPLRRLPLQFLGLLGPLSKWRDLPPCRYKRSPRRRRSTSRPRPTAAPPPCSLVGQKHGYDCVGAYSGAAGAALSFAARAMIVTGQTLLRFATECDRELRLFTEFVLGTSRQICSHSMGSSSSGRCNRRTALHSVALGAAGAPTP